MVAFGITDTEWVTEMLIIFKLSCFSVCEENISVTNQN